MGLLWEACDHSNLETKRPESVGILESVCALGGRADGDELFGCKLYPIRNGEKD
jgi:hypothetical protein